MIVDRLVRGKDPASAGLIRSRPRLKRAWAAAGSSPAIDAQTYVRGWRCAPLRDGSPSSPSPTCFDTTAPWGPARSARVSAGRWSSTWAASSPTRRGRSARARWPRGRRRPIEGFLEGLLDAAARARHSGRRSVPAFDRRAGEPAARGRARQRLHRTEGLFRGPRAPVVTSCGCALS